MVDNFPINPDSQLRTDPSNIARSVFRRQPSLSQIGRVTSYTSIGDTFSITRKPTYYQLAA